MSSRLVNLAHNLPLPATHKFAWGSVLSMAGRLSLLVGVVAMALAILVGEYSAMSSISKARDTWYREGNLADVELRFSPTPGQKAPHVSSIPGVTAASTRAIQMGRTDVGDTKGLALTVIETPSALPGASVNLLTPIEGRLLTAGDSQGALIDQGMAKYHQLGVGDKLRVSAPSQELNVTIRGIVRDPESLIAPLNPSLFVSAKGSMGVVYMAPGTLGGATNSIIVRLDDQQRRETVREQLLTRASGLGITDAYAIARDEQFGYQYVEKNLQVFSVVIPTMVLVGALSAAFVSAFLSAQWVSRERKKIALLLVLGHSRSAVIRGFIPAFIALALSAFALGMLLAYGVGKAFLANFAGSVGLPEVSLSFAPNFVVLGAVGVTVVFALGAAVAFAKIFRMSPREAMTETVASEGRQRMRGLKLGNLLPTTSLRMAVRNSQRSPWVSALTTLSIGLGFGLTAAFFLSYSSVMETSRTAVDGNAWDMTVDFSQPLGPGQAQQVLEDGGVERWTPVTKAVAQGEHDGTTENLFIGGFDPENKWHVVHMLQGHDISSGEPEGLVLETSLADRLGVRVGDTLTVKAAGRKEQATVVGVMSSALPGEVRTTMEFANSLSGRQGWMTGVLAQTDPANIGSITKELNDSPHVQQALTKAQIVSLIVASSDQITALLWLGAFMSIAVALLFMGACLGYTILERRDEYRTMSLLGFDNSSIRFAVVLEATMLGVIGIILSFPIALIVSTALDDRISEVWFKISSHMSVQPFLMTFIPGLILLPLAAMPLARLVLKTSVSGSQARGIG